MDNRCRSEGARYRALIVARVGPRNCQIMPVRLCRTAGEHRARGLESGKPAQVLVLTADAWEPATGERSRLCDRIHSEDAWTATRPPKTTVRSLDPACASR